METEPARSRERALGEILEVIARSREDEGPVFEAILAAAARLCDAPIARLLLANEARTHYRFAAAWGGELWTVSIGDMYSLDLPLIIPMTIREARSFHVPDLRDTDEYRAGVPQRVLLVDGEGIRTHLTVPLVSDGVGIGCICLAKREVAPFSEDDIALVRSFAAQAAIAVENVRQFRELQTRLEREAATREVLEVISRSRDDEAPVFDAILRRAAALCRSTFAGLALIDEDGAHLVYTASHGPALSHSKYGRMKWDLNGQSSFAEAVRERRAVRIDNLADTDLYRAGDPQRVAHVEEDGLRSFMAVPLFRKDEAIGAFGLAKWEVAPFSEDDLEIVSGFAAQAVIAIDNVRQFRELQTRLEREKASREILGVISRSRGDEAPVFDTIFENLARLCATPQALLMLVSGDGSKLEFVASRGSGREEIDRFRRENPIPVDADDVFAKSFRERRPITVDDLRETTTWGSHEQDLRAAADAIGIRSFLIAPLVSGGVAVGVIAIYRHEVKPFAPDEIALLEGFAAQAVIAIENVRQFKALESLNEELGDRVQAQVGEIERMGRLKRFLPAAVADAVVSSGSERMLASHRALLGILFCDIRGFTAFCEQAEPEETIEVLQTYHQEMGLLVAAHGAGVDHRMGDGIMVLFNDPLPCEDPAGEAVRLALAMRARMVELCAGWRRLGHRLGFGVGVSLGYATVGMVGHEGRFDYTASGTAVNLAARLCERAEDGEILLSPRAFAAVEAAFRCEPAGALELKGLDAPVEVMRAVAVK